MKKDVEGSVVVKGPLQGGKGGGAVRGVTGVTGEKGGEN